MLRVYSADLLEFSDTDVKYTNEDLRGLVRSQGNHLTFDDLYKDETRRAQKQETRLRLPNTPSTRSPKAEKTEKA